MGIHNQSLLNKSWTPDLSKVKLLDFLSDVVLNQLRVDARKLRMVVQEPLDVRDHSANHSLHGWTGSQALSLRLWFNTRGQLTDSADLQKQSSAPLVESGFGISQHYGSNISTTALFNFFWLSVIKYYSFFIFPHSFIQYNDCTIVFTLLLRWWQVKQADVAVFEDFFQLLAVRDYGVVCQTHPVVLGGKDLFIRHHTCMKNKSNSWNRFLLHC